MGCLDYRLYVVTSGADRRTVEAAAQAARAGAGFVQVRAKELSATHLLSLVVAVGEAVAEANPTTRVVVDDRCDVAYAAMRMGAHVHGVHLGQDDLPVDHARAMLGPWAVIGLTTGTVELVRAANAVAVLIDYLGAGPFRHTPTKDSGREPLGLGGYPRLVAATALPIVAIGGIGVADVAALRRTGVAGVAVVRAVMDSPEPGRVAAAIRSAWDAAEPPERATAYGAVG